MMQFVSSSTNGPVSLLKHGRPLVYSVVPRERSFLGSRSVAVIGDLKCDCRQRTVPIGSIASTYGISFYASTAVMGVDSPSSTTCTSRQDARWHTRGLHETMEEKPPHVQDSCTSTNGEPRVVVGFRREGVQLGEMLI